MVEQVDQAEVADWLSGLDTLSPDLRDQLLTVCAKVIESMAECEQGDSLGWWRCIDCEMIQCDWLLAQMLERIATQEHFVCLRGLWLGAYHLLEAGKSDQLVEIDMLSVNKEDLLENFTEFIDITGSGLFHHVYTKEYDQPGGKPYTSLLLGYAFDKTGKDLSLLGYIAQVAAACHAPAIGNVDLNLLGIRELSEIETIDLHALFSQTDYQRWNAFRARDSARYLGLILPRLRMPVPWEGARQRFCSFGGMAVFDWAWIPAVFGFGILLIQAFRKFGWCAQLTGPHGGGLLEELVPPALSANSYHFVDSPLEVNLSDRQELHLATHGLMSLTFARYLERAVLYNAPSLQRRDLADGNPAANLPYLYLISRFGHCQKVIQRESIGVSTDPVDLEVMLSRWLSRYVSSMPNASAEARAERPLKEGQVKVTMDPANPGYFQVTLTLKPHLHMEGIDTRLSLTSKIRR